MKYNLRFKLIAWNIANKYNFAGKIHDDGQDGNVDEKRDDI